MAIPESKPGIRSLEGGKYVCALRESGKSGSRCSSLILGRFLQSGFLVPRLRAFELDRNFDPD
jgi:hypothetical protein